MSSSRFPKYAWGVLAYNLAVILWGAYVRATGSGAGCGAHWPLCNGVVVPQSPALATRIEFTHRLSSGLALVLAVGLLVWAWRAYPRGHLARRGAALVMLFTLSEALVGAALVLLELVASNDSVMRAVAIAVHLTNTFLLLAALALAARWASGGGAVRLRARSGATWALGVGLLGVLTLGITGAITALGDTLFPSASLSQGLQADFSPTAHFLIRLRFFHPLIAVLVGFYVIVLASVLAGARRGTQTRRAGRALIGLVVLQLTAGGVNVLLLAPVWMQMVHLLLADLLWVSLLLFAARVLAEPAASPAEVTVPAPAYPRQPGAV